MDAHKPTTVIDAKGHLIGRLASVVAKQVLLGKNIVVVRCEDLVRSGSIAKRMRLFRDFQRKRCNVNPKKGPFHFRAPTKIFWRMVRGMIPYKTPRGTAALNRLSLFEGVPAPFDKMRLSVCPKAMRSLRLDPADKVTHLGTLATRVGWRYQALIAKLEERRKAAGQKFFDEKQKKRALVTEAVASHAEIQKINASLAEFGF